MGSGGVRHRIDGLENQTGNFIICAIVRHRIDGLENCYPIRRLRVTVRHRIDGLEIALWC